MSRGHPYRTSGADAEPEPLSVTELRREIERLEHYPNPSRFSGGQRGIRFEIEWLQERIEEILTECVG